MQVDPEALRARSPKFAAAADKLDKAFQDLKSAREAEGNCWGNDDPGTAFHEEYAKALNESDATFTDLGEALNRTKEQLDQVSEQWESDDQSSAEGVENAGRAL
nr:WXG100 family type VII secretion target [Saccharopolyspora sp. HNM0983]